MDTHKVEVNLPKLVDRTARSLIGTGRGKDSGGSDKKGGSGYGPLLAALAIKGSFLGLAYKGKSIVICRSFILNR